MSNYDYSKLNGRIIEVCGSQAEFAKRMKMSEHSVSHKLNNKTNFKQDDIDRALTVLHLEKASIPDYFFTAKVQAV